MVEDNVKTRKPGFYLDLRVFTLSGIIEKILATLRFSCCSTYAGRAVGYLVIIYLVVWWQ